MLSLVITKNDYSLSEATPDIYLSDSDFDTLLADKKLRMLLFHAYNHGNDAVIVGRLGSQNSEGIFVEEPKIQNNSSVSNKEKELSYYALY